MSHLERSKLPQIQCADAPILLQQASVCQIAHEMAGAKAPRLTVLTMPHAVDEAAKLGGSDSDNVADLVGETLPRRIAVLGRRKQRAEKQHGAVGIIMVRPDQLTDQVERISADPIHVRDIIEAKSVRADDSQAHGGRA